MPLTLVRPEKTGTQIVNEAWRANPEMAVGGMENHFF